MAFINYITNKNTLASIFKWLVALKQHLPRPKFSYENLSSSPILSYTVTKKLKIFFFAAQKSLRILKFPRVFIERVVFRFSNDRVLFRFLIDRILFRVSIESSVIGSSSGSTVIDSSLGSSVFFFIHARIFFIKFSKRSWHLATSLTLKRLGFNLTPAPVVFPKM